MAAEGAGYQMCSSRDWVLDVVAEGTGYQMCSRRDWVPDVVAEGTGYQMWWQKGLGTRCGSRWDGFLRRC